MYNGAYGNCTAGLYRKKLSETLSKQRLQEGVGGQPMPPPAPDVSSISNILRTGVDHYGEQLRGLSSLPDTSPEKLRASLLFHTFKGSKAELASKSPKVVIQDLLSSLSNENIGDNFTLELSKRLQAIADSIPDEAPGIETGAPAGPDAPAAGPADQIEPDPGAGGDAPSSTAEPESSEPEETAQDPEVSPDEFGDLVDKLEQ